MYGCIHNVYAGYACTYMNVWQLTGVGTGVGEGEGGGVGEFPLGALVGAGVGAVVGAFGQHHSRCQP
jgi:hypothetical protein